MKKIIALLLAAVMVMCLFAGCASSGSKVIKIGVFEQVAFREIIECPCRFLEDS